MVVIKRGMNMLITKHFPLKRLAWVLKSIILDNEDIKLSKEEICSIKNKALERLHNEGHFKALSLERDGVYYEVIV